MNDTKSIVQKVQRKSFTIRPSGRSSDFITPSFGYGCLLNCSYCYMKRKLPEGLKYAENIGDILTEINNHSFFTPIKKPNQTDNFYITYDIACNEDFALHAKYYPWERIFEFFRDHPIAKATLATKIIPVEFLKYDPENKVRIRFSLMPQKISSVLEPNTPDIIDRIKAVDAFIEAGYDVHLNYSPVVVYPNWIEDYIELFELVDSYIEDDHKEHVKAEVIFLTHNSDKHQYNVERSLPGEELLWTPNTQEPKKSQYGGNNVRYRANLKKGYIEEFKHAHNSNVPWQTIRYIF